MAAHPILLGVIGRPHGVRGHVHVHSYTALPEDLASYPMLHDGAGRRFALTWLGGDVAQVTEFSAQGRKTLTDRADAERLTNTKLFVDRSDLPDAGEEEYYLADLIGLSARDEDGRALGTISAVHDYGAGASLEFSGPRGVEIVPFTHACVPEVDIPGGTVTIRLPDELIVEDASMEPAE